MPSGLCELIVLGSATPYPRPDEPCSGYLVAAGRTKIWLDAGTGTLAELQRYTRLDEVDAIWISHLHADHATDLLTAYYALLYADLQPSGPIPLFAPPGTADRLAGFLTNTPTRSPIERAFSVEELQDGHHAQVGPLSLTSRAVEHGMPAFAVRLEETGEGNRPGGSLVYSGDTASCPPLTELADGCDTLLCEVGCPSAPEGEEQVHLTPEQAGLIARDSRTSQLVLTHVDPGLTWDETVSRVRTVHAGPVQRAVRGLRTPIRPEQGEPSRRTS